ncbi:pentapeptide repeat-containing protein [Microcoleus asticus]|nr:pentapeptide repeat-containing protein [Microcoleus asticus]
MVIEEAPIVFWSSIVALTLLAGFIFATYKQGLGLAVGAFSLIAAFLLILVGGLGTTEATAAALVQSIAIAGAIAGAIIGAFALAVLKTLIGNIAVFIYGIASSVGSLAGGWEGIENGKKHLVQALPVVALVTLALLSLSFWIGWNISDRDNKYLLVYKPANWIASIGGTRFRGSNLTTANFTEANLNSTDFRDSILKRTCWFEAKNLEKARTEGTYLQNQKVRQLVVNKKGKNQHFEHLNLRDLHLEKVDLQDAYLNGADLSGTTLENATLAGARLAKAQLYQANLKGAGLTGAYIENWGISTDTNLDAVKCDYIYMKVPTEADPDPCRKPDNRKEIFRAGDFTDFIAPIVKTLELYQTQNVDLRVLGRTFKTLDFYHYEGIDPSVAAIALKQLAEQHPEAGLKVVVLQGVGEEKIRLQARVTEETDRSKLSAEYIEKYQEIASLPYGDLQSLLAAMAEKDERIRGLENMVMAAMKSEKFYVETYYNFGDDSDENKTVKKILILTANPQNIDKRRLDAEVREIQTGLERAKKRDQFEIISKWAVRPDDLRRALLDYEPQIVHFSGGATTDGLALENELGQLQMVSTAALAKLFDVFKDQVECVLLNACYSETQAEVISQHIDYVIGMNRAIGNRAAIEFAVGFYDALGAGRSIEDAFKLGCIAIDLEGIPESLTPVLKKKE